MSTTQTTVEPIQRSVTVNRNVDDAFRVFTEEISSWWPVAAGGDATARGSPIVRATPTPLLTTDTS